MKLSEKDIEILHYHINGKHIQYIEVRDEILDHYQTALEQEEERSFEDVLAELDKTFTIGYSRQTARNYLQNLKAEYPIRFKEDLFALFTTKKIWLTLVLLGFVISIPYWIPRSGTLVHLLNLIMLFSISFENLIITKNYPNNKRKHHYRDIDDKPVFAITKSDSPKGVAILHVVCFVVIMIPLFLFSENILYKPPYLYATIVGIWLFLMMTIIRFRTKTKLSKPQIN